ncbi:MAG: ABC transporter substrate-binding protein [Armatimonadota bacterium]|nr:ABC transporter substrate-binding protein [Armatimonadota bacterium]MDR7448291.1 ABC transporter substrate-binding protein [Armatimonadota bacterium]MDR7458320.1 ABC transporter substrate-binding protein [Armatimonadota bacterium]MDR7478377.1 ABC transporter substrate-binding protein [Armatimonadota bacterium]MDR7487311.1 ABC transporter substrate-binding protein [Armatimonadota bacterium]
MRSTRGIGVVLAMALALLLPGVWGVRPTGGAPAGGITIEYWHIFSETFGGPVLRSVVSRFNESQGSVRVVERLQPGGYIGLLQSLQAAIAARTPPAVAVIGYNFTEFVIDTFPHKPAQEFPGWKELLAGFAPRVVAFGQKHGRQHGIPYSLSVPVMFYNADLFRAAGLDPDRPPATWEEVLQAALAIRARTGKFGVFLWNRDTFVIQSLVESAGGAFMSLDNRRVTVNAPANREALQFYSDLVNVHRVTPLATSDEAQASFLRGEIAMHVASIANLENFQRSARFTLRTAAFPTFGTRPRRVVAGGNNLFVFALDPRQQEAAWKLIRYLVSADGLSRWTTGLGYLSPLRRMVEAQKVRPLNPLARPALETLDAVVRWTNFPGSQGPQAERAILDAVTAILSGRTPVAQALDEAQARITDLVGR